MMMELMPVWLQAGAGNPLREFLLENILTGLSEAWRPLVADLLTWSLTCALIMGIALMVGYLINKRSHLRGGDN